MLKFCKKIFYVLFFLIFLLFSIKKITNANNEFKAKMYIDNPTYNQNIKDRLYIRGWVMANTKDIEISLYVDDLFIEKLERNQQRPDVLKAIKEYGTKIDNPIPGFEKNIDTTYLTDGIHILKIVVNQKETNEELCSSETRIYIKKYNSLMCIDNPKVNETLKNSIFIRGWIMSELKKIDINLYIDNVLVRKLERNEYRPDVLKAIKGYGGENSNPIPGFKAMIDTSNLSDGIHTIKTEVIDINTGEIIRKDQRSIVIKKYNTRICVDSPLINGKATKDMELRGWVMSEAADISINFYIDDSFIEKLERNESRPDVLKAVLNCGSKEQNPIPGFNYKIDLSNYINGKHIVKIDLVNNRLNETIYTTTRVFYLIKYPSIMCIDNETSYKASTKQIIIRGWVMSMDSSIKIAAYLDNNKILDITRNEYREDVLRLIKGYGTEKENPIPGFNVACDASKIDEGNHIIKIIVTNSSKEILTSSIYNITVNNKIMKGIDVSIYQGIIDWKKVKDDNVDFVIIRAGYRGYGSNGTLVTDGKFKANIEGAIKNNIDVGVYFFSQAINEKEAIEEANYVLNLVKGYKIAYPIVIDTEESSSPSKQGRADGLSKEERTIVVKAFCNTIVNAGYEPMIYANKWWLTEKLDLSKLSNYIVWLAHYTGATKDNPFLKQSDYKGKYVMWQYTDKGSINGITGYVDLNVTIP